MTEWRMCIVRRGEEPLSIDKFKVQFSTQSRKRGQMDSLDYLRLGKGRRKIEEESSANRQTVSGQPQWNMFRVLEVREKWASWPFGGKSIKFHAGPLSGASRKSVQGRTAVGIRLAKAKFLNSVQSLLWK